MTDHCVFCGEEAAYLDGPKMCYACNDIYQAGFESGFEEGKRSRSLSEPM